MNLGSKSNPFDRRKMCTALSAGDGALALAFMACQSIADQRVSAMQVVVSDFFWMAVLWACMSKFAVPRWVVGGAGFYLTLVDVVIGVMRVSSFLHHGRPSAALVNAIFLLGCVVNVVFFMLWLRRQPPAITNP